MYTIKYLGEPVLLRELIDTDGLSEAEILGPEICLLYTSDAADE